MYTPLYYVRVPTVARFVAKNSPLAWHHRAADLAASTGGLARRRCVVPVSRYPLSEAIVQDPTRVGIAGAHSHVFLGAGHEQNERKTWTVIVLCTVMMLAEIIGGSLFGSLALVADGLHMSTHAGAILIAALAYTYARRHASDPRFGFGTGKLGDLAGYSSAMVLAVIALLIGCEAVVRFLSPVPIHFAEAIPIAVVGLGVNLLSAWLLRGGDRGHSDGHGSHRHEQGATEQSISVEHPHRSHSAHRDHNIRSAYVHVVADAAVSMVTIVGLVLARTFTWLWMDPLASIVGAFVIANWAYGLIRDTAGVLLDVVPDQRMQGQIRKTIEDDGDQLVDLHLWRLGPGHLGVVLSVLSDEPRTPDYFRTKLSPFPALSHITVEVRERSALIASSSEFRVDA
jgi:cation diffusion facilitator family transporter